MISKADHLHLSKKGISAEVVAEQLKRFKTGFPFLKLEGAATTECGVLAPSQEEIAEYLKIWDSYCAAGNAILKFVPASGAASRMFKNLFEFLTGGHDEPVTDFEHVFFDHIEFFGFYAALNAKCVELYEKDINTLMAESSHRKVVAALLNPEGLNSGQLPKGLLLFHLYADETVRTPLEEHLVEGALYAQDENKNVHVHFTVSPEHRELFMAKVASVVARYEEEFGVKYDITFSEQKASTDTIAADKDNNPFRDTDGSLVFGGVYAQGGELYLLTDVIPIGTDLYIHDVAVDNRTLENGDVIPFSFIKVINAVADGGTFAFTATEEKILELKAAAHGNNSIPWSALMGYVPNDKIANNSITFEKMFGVITPEKMQNSSKNVIVSYGSVSVQEGDSVGLPVRILASSNCIYVHECRAQGNFTFLRVNNYSAACQGFFRVYNVSDDTIRVTVPTFSQTNGVPVAGTSNVTIASGDAKLFFFSSMIDPSATNGSGYIYVVGAIDAL